MKLKDFRAYNAGLSQAQLAERASIDESTVWLIEHGRSFKPVTAGRILKALSKELGRPVDRNEIDEFAEKSG